jgi:sulfur carrier protein ThiS
MKITANVMGERTEVEISEGSTIFNVYEKLGLNSETYIAKKGNKLLFELENLEEGDELEIIRIVSGG